jgi:hypothetical protein
LKIKSQQDFVAGLLFVLLGLAFAIAAFDYRLGRPCEPGEACAVSLWARFVHTSAAPGPGYFPFGLGLLLALLGALLMLKALTFETEGGEPIGAIAWRPLSRVVLAITAFAVLLPLMGFYVAAGVTLALAMQAERSFHTREVWLAALVGTALAALWAQGLALWLDAVVVPAAQALASTLGLDPQQARARPLAMLATRLVLLGLVWWALRQVPPRWRRVAVMVTLVMLLVCVSVWVFVQALGLTLPLAPDPLTQLRRWEWLAPLLRAALAPDLTHALSC